MKGGKDNQPFNLEEMEKWLENFFLDPLTSYLDQITFRIDLFETEKELIVEAMLPDFKQSEITVYVKDNEIKITALKSPPTGNGDACDRTVEFPFLIIDKQIYAEFHNGIMEVFISKTQPGPGINRFIPLS